jgi:monothiol glutaredoxin
MSLSEALRGELESLVKEHEVVLFMKGSRRSPQCGFSASVVEILDRVLEDYTTVDVLSRPEVREGIKEFSDWPTIPQLYIDGEFVGGADIVREMSDAGELKEMLGDRCSAPSQERSSPLVGGELRLTVTPAAVAAIQAAREDDEPETLRLEIPASYEHALYFDAKKSGDVEVQLEGQVLLVDPQTAPRAQAIHIDYINDGEREGFKIDNPNRKKEQAAAPRSAPPKPPRPEHPPVITVTDGAKAQFVAAIEAEGEGEHAIRVAARRMGADKVDYELGIITEEERHEDDFDLQVVGIRFFVDPRSARNVDGATIDFVETGAQGSGFKFENENIKGWDDPRADQFQKLLETEINPSIAAHGGYVELLDMVGDNAYVVMGGGCQGCGMAAVTLNQGIAERVREVMPDVVLVDTTDHASGDNPYYQSGK